MDEFRKDVVAHVVRPEEMRRAWGLIRFKTIPWVVRSYPTSKQCQEDENQKEHDTGQADPGAAGVRSPFEDVSFSQLSIHFFEPEDRSRHRSDPQPD